MLLASGKFPSIHAFPLTLLHLDTKATLLTNSPLNSQGNVIRALLSVLAFVTLKLKQSSDPCLVSAKGGGASLIQALNMAKLARAKPEWIFPASRELGVDLRHVINNHLPVKSDRCSSLDVPILLGHIFDSRATPIQYPLNISFTLWNSPDHLLGQHISEAGKRLTLALQVLVTPLYSLHKLSCVYVWIATLVDIVYDFWRETYWQRGS